MGIVANGRTTAIARTAFFVASRHEENSIRRARNKMCSDAIKGNRPTSVQPSELEIKIGVTASAPSAVPMQTSVGRLIEP